jgi:hypothetical protein
MKQELIQELETTPDFVIEEVYHFLIFVKTRNTTDLTPPKLDNSILNMIDEIISEVPPEEWEKLPKDFAENIDYYLYGVPNRIIKQQ